MGQAGGERQIVLAEVAGFCFGVQRAVEMTEAARRDRAGRVTTLGALVHNEQVIARMEAQGIGRAAALEEVRDGTVVLSAHGAAPAVRAQAKAQGLDVMDVTCPFVTKVHRMAKQLHEQGYQVVLVGDAGHTEVKGVVGLIESLGGTVTVVATVEAARAVSLGKKVGVVSQTTQRPEQFAAIVAELCRRTADVRAINTICNATADLQAAAARLARQVDVVIVIGGRQSANTRRLRQLCEEAGTPAYQIETASEIVPAWLEGKERIGLTAGASTPDWILEEVARHLNGGALPAGWRLRHPE